MIRKILNYIKLISLVGFIINAKCVNFTTIDF